ncbi:MAG: 23S rRNA (adenine(2503)-C(2))-methyltransferase RlmN [Spirochaetales bacterium]|nr:23S rRNA (adenine(2503)-C(2))-methyltransferase RlmN [Spirochaetales bacterium]
MMHLLDFTRAELIDHVRETTGRGDFYGDALFRELYGNPQKKKERADSPVFQKFYNKITRETPLPGITERRSEEGTTKYLLPMAGGYSSESVLIPMKNYSTLCLSSQIGCRFACAFCATGQMGFIRNLSAAEILAQVLAARFELGCDNLQNIVFMGMGEPFDNFENVIKAVDILSDERGRDIPKRRISLSTAGHCEGIRRLSALCASRPEENYHTLHLSISLHSALEETRNSLMPIGRRYPLEDLRQALLDSPYSRIKDGLYIEYLIIPGVTDTAAGLDALKAFLEGMEAKINLIPYNPVKGSPWKAPTNEETDRVWKLLKDAGYYCRTRLSKGENMMAACGQLGSRSNTE